MTEDIDEILHLLRTSGGDTASIEVKSAAGGLPESLTSTLSALANLPGGGLIVLGLDERTGFRPVGLSDPQGLKQALASKARNFVPPVRVAFEDAEVDGAHLVLARVHECDPSSKPCRAAKSGAAYLRGWDGDYRMSTLEEQAFLSQRTAPMSDREPCRGATIDDLDGELTESFLRTVRERDPQGLGRFSDRTELMRRAGVVDGDGTPTVAGILAMGAYPQQWLPRFAIQAAVDSGRTGAQAARVRNQKLITGPIPHMIDQAMAWARTNFSTDIVARADGSVIDRPAYPLVAFRELVANALIHRDLSSWSAGLATEVRLCPDRLIVSNPGGLHGITLDRLGREAVSSARNAQLLSICQYLRTPESGRVVEALATGIPAVAGALVEAGLPAAHYTDTAIRFTAALSALPAAPKPELKGTKARVYDALSTELKTVAQLEAELALNPATIRLALRGMRSDGLIEQVGGRGRRTGYRRLDE
ncbi:putative DNA binding domain-containing protein [Glycomyces sp. A-F 0318]|uniref:ATP-binding protein n=1 Tax=Glycomyces amatae TaxID=2881355 RepID=UPI001E405BBE|nr:putative DNA binding domain-containing protein [Glycomyces amatae]